jgi:hypothetical protein
MPAPAGHVAGGIGGKSEQFDRDLGGEDRHGGDQGRSAYPQVELEMSWNLQQISNASGQAQPCRGEQIAIPQAAAERWFVCAFGNQLHFTYADAGNNTLER